MRTSIELACPARADQEITRQIGVAGRKQIKGFTPDTREFVDAEQCLELRRHPERLGCVAVFERAGLGRVQSEGQSLRAAAGVVARGGDWRHILADAEHLVAAGDGALSGTVVDVQMRPAAARVAIADLGVGRAAFARDAFADFAVALHVARSHGRAADSTVSLPRLRTGR